MAEQSVPLDARLLGEAIDAAWDSEIHQPLHSVDQGRGYFQLRPAPGLAARVAAEYARLVPQPARPADTALLGCDIDGDETLGDWALRLADERIEGIVEPHELAHAKHRRAELRAALAAQPSAEQPGEEER